MRNRRHWSCRRPFLCKSSAEATLSRGSPAKLCCSQWLRQWLCLWRSVTCVVDRYRTSRFRWFDVIFSCVDCSGRVRRYGVVLEGWRLGRTLLWRVAGDGGGRLRGSVGASRYHAFSSLYFLLLHRDRPVGAVKLEVQPCAADLVSELKRLQPHGNTTRTGLTYHKHCR
jgi:hypothetical protein